MIGSIVLQLSEDATPDDIKKSGFDSYYVDHGLGIYPASASGVPFNASYLQSKGDPITDLYENMAAEQKARSTYEYILNLTDDPDVISPIKFLRAREIVHFQRFGEALRYVQDYLDSERCFVMPKPDCMKKDEKKDCKCKKDEMEKPKRDCNCMPNRPSMPNDCINRNMPRNNNGCCPNKNDMQNNSNRRY